MIDLVVWAAKVPLCTLNGVIYLALFLGEEVHVRKHMSVGIALTTLTQMVIHSYKKGVFLTQAVREGATVTYRSAQRGFMHMYISLSAVPMVGTLVEDLLSHASPSLILYG